MCVSAVVLKAFVVVEMLLAKLVQFWFHFEEPSMDSGV